MYNYGYDTLRAFQWEDYSQFFSTRFQQEFKRNQSYSITYNNAEIQISFPNGMTVLSFSIPKLLNNGCNIVLASVNEAIEATDIITEFLGVDFAQFNISRLDIATNILSSIRARAYVNHLRKPPYFKALTKRRNGVYYHTAEKIEESGRVLVFYQKENLVRIESRFFSKAELGKSASLLIKAQLRHEALVSELSKESFYVNSAYYLNNLVVSAIPKGKLKSESRVILDGLKSSLETNLHYSIPSQFLRNVC